MKKEILQTIGNIAGEIANRGVGDSFAKNRSSANTAGNIAYLVIDSITGTIDRGGRGKNQSGAGRCGVGGGSGGGLGAGCRGRGGGSGR